MQGREIAAFRVGYGPIKVVLVGDIHGGPEANTYLLAQQLLAHFEANPTEVPERVSLWIVPTINPDGLASGERRNANGVDLNRNADTDLDGCAGNDWTPDAVGPDGPQPGAGGDYPFSEPEALALRDFLADAWVAVFYHSSAGAVYVDHCGRHLPTARLAQVVASSSGYDLPAEGWTGYQVTGDFGDYLAGEGVAAVTVELSNHQDTEFERNLDGVRSLLAVVEEIVEAEASAVGAEVVWLDAESTGTWTFGAGSFVHPLALERIGASAFLLDGGRVLELDLGLPGPPRPLLAPGSQVDGVRVLEPLDLATDGTSLLVLDRAGDLYRYEPATGRWTVERRDRATSATSDHYYVALAATPGAAYLLDTTHERVLQVAPGRSDAIAAELAKGRDVDLAVDGSGLYALSRGLNSPAARLAQYRDGRQVAAFQPNAELVQPLQVCLGGEAVWVLDRDGREVVALDSASGRMRALYRFTDRRPVTAMWADNSGTAVILAGRDALYFLGQPLNVAAVAEEAELESPQPHDPVVLEGLHGLQMPIEGARVSSRDFQLPGAPRHYRLGLHEGLDFYSHTVGVPVNRHTPVHAVADGTVIRALVDYRPLTAAQAESFAAETRRLGYTPPEVLDGYRGMQIWIDHGGGLVSRYAHLGSIAPGVVEGATVVRGQVIGTVGNSGTPESLRSAEGEVHLHLELWIGDHNVGEFLRPVETRVALERILRWVPSALSD